jgi:hypothetical protein
MMSRVEVSWYTTWAGVKMIALAGGPRLNMAITREEASALRDDLTKALEEITQDEEQEP